LSDAVEKIAMRDPGERKAHASGAVIAQRTRSLISLCFRFSSTLFVVFWRGRFWCETGALWLYAIVAFRACIPGLLMRDKATAVEQRARQYIHGGSPIQYSAAILKSRRSSFLSSRETV
jgi:hypothetical protein